MSVQPKSFLVISNEPWGKQWYSKHHYANELSKQGYQVYYVDPPKPWNPLNIIRRRVEVEDVNKNLKVVRVLNPFPVKIFTKFFTWLNDVVLFHRVKGAIHISEETVLWQFDFNRYVFRPKSHMNSIYHVADPYMHAWSDLILARKANLVVCTSPKYMDYYCRHVDSKKIVLIPHGMSLDEFDLSPVDVENIKKKYAPFCLMVGSLNDDVDYDLMNQVGAKFKLIILGSDNIKDDENRRSWVKVKNHANVEYLGIVPAPELKNYIAAADCCLLLYKFNLKKVIGTGSPLKVMNYLAQYKPVIASIDPETPDLLDKAIYWVDNPEDYLDKLALAMRNRLIVDEDLVRGFLRDRTYPHLIEIILGNLAHGSN